MVADEDRVELALAVEIDVLAAWGEHGLVGGHLIDDPGADDGQLLPGGLLVCALMGDAGSLPLLDGFLEVLGWRGLGAPGELGVLPLEEGNGVAEAEGKAKEEVPDSAPRADVRCLAILDDLAPICDVTQVVVGALTGVLLSWPDNAVFWEELDAGPLDNTVTGKVEAESGDMLASLRNTFSEMLTYLT